MVHPPGSILQQRYRIEAVLGRGGMGGVYLARNLELDIMVAVKQLLLGDDVPTMRTSALKAFTQEANILNQLEHGRLPRVLDFFEDERGNPYLVMDYIKGRNLSVVVESEEPLDEILIRQWAEELCEVLAYLHGHSPPVIFRDLKPANIMLDYEGQIKLIDFGISKLFELGDTASLNTNTLARGCVSPGYGAPEQYAGKTDARSDIYSLGATLYFVATRNVPVPSVQRIIDAESLEPVATLRPDLSPELCALIHRLMALRASERAANMAEVSLWFRALPSLKDGRAAARPPAASPFSARTRVVLPHEWPPDVVQASLRAIEQLVAEEAQSVPSPPAARVPLTHAPPTQIVERVVAVQPAPLAGDDTLVPLWPAHVSHEGPQPRPLMETPLWAVEAPFVHPPHPPATAEEAGGVRTLLALVGVALLLATAAVVLHRQIGPSAPSQAIAAGSPDRVVAASRLTVRSQPSEAQVYLDDTYVGTTPFTAPALLPGEYQLSLRKSGYADQRQPVLIDAGHDSSVDITMPAARAVVSIVSNVENTQLLLDGTLIGLTGPVPTDVKVGPGRHVLLLSHAGYSAVNRTVEVGETSRERVRVVLQPLPAPPPRTR